MAEKQYRRIDGPARRTDRPSFKDSSQDSAYCLWARSSLRTGVPGIIRDLRSWLSFSGFGRRCCCLSVGLLCCCCSLGALWCCEGVCCCCVSPGCCRVVVECCCVGAGCCRVGVESCWCCCCCCVEKRCECGENVFSLSPDSFPSSMFLPVEFDLNFNISNFLRAELSIKKRKL